MGKVVQLPEKIVFEMNDFFDQKFLGIVRKILSHKGYRNSGLVMRLIRLEKFIAEQLDLAEKTRQKLLEPFLKKGEDGKPVVDNDRFELTDPAAYDIEWKKLLKETVAFKDENKIPLDWLIEVDLSPNEIGRIGAIIKYPKEDKE